MPKGSNGVADRARGMARPDGVNDAAAGAACRRSAAGPAASWQAVDRPERKVQDVGSQDVAA